MSELGGGGGGFMWRGSTQWAGGKSELQPLGCTAKGACLVLDVLSKGFSKLGAHLTQKLRLLVDHVLGLLVGGSGAAFDDVGGQGERGSDKAKNRGLVANLCTSCRTSWH